MIMMTMMTKDKYRMKIDEDEGGYEQIYIYIYI